MTTTIKPRWNGGRCLAHITYPCLRIYEVYAL